MQLNLYWYRLMLDFISLLYLYFLIWQRNHRPTKSQVGRDINNHVVQPFLANHDLGEMSQHTVQPNLRRVWHWGVHHFPAVIIPVVGCSQCAKFSTCVQSIVQQDNSYFLTSFFKDLAEFILLLACYCSLIIKNAFSRSKYYLLCIDT